MQKRTACGSLPMFPLLAGVMLMPMSARALAPSDAPVTANFSHASVRTALDTLFQNAGVRNFILEDGIQGTVNVSLSDVPFSLALRQTLAAATPALAFDVLNGVYHIHVKAPSLPQTSAPLLRLEVFGAADAPPDEGADRFYKIGVKNYDAGMMADLATRPDGIIVVPPNFVVPANQAVSGGSLSGGLSNPAQPAVTTVGERSAVGGRSVSAATGLQSAPAAANNALPDGVRRIYARESDNSLIVEATPSGLARLPL